MDRKVDPGAVARRRLFLFVAGVEGQRGCGLVRQLLRHFLLGRNFESTTITTITKTIGDNNTLRSVRKMKWSVWAVCFLDALPSLYIDGFAAAKQKKTLNFHQLTISYFSHLDNETNCRRLEEIFYSHFHGSDLLWWCTWLKHYAVS